VPCGRVNGLPVGLMLVGRHFEETTLIRLASAIEAGGDWTLN
jgi:amidase